MVAIDFDALPKVTAAAVTTTASSMSLRSVFADGRTTTSACSDSKGMAAGASDVQIA